MFATAYAPREESRLVDVAGRPCDFDEFVAATDADLYYEALEWTGANATRQAVVDDYRRRHETRYGAPFVMPL